MRDIFYLTEDNYYCKLLDKDCIILKSQYYLGLIDGRNIFYEDKQKKKLLISLAELGQPEAIALYYELFGRFENNIIDNNLEVMNKLDDKTNVLNGRTFFAQAIYEFSQRDINAFNEDINYLMNLVESLRVKSLTGDIPNNEIKKFFEEYYTALDDMMNKYPFTDTMSLAILIMKANADEDSIYFAEFLEYVDFITMNFPIGAFSLDVNNIEYLRDVRRQFGIEAFKISNQHPEEINPLYSAGVMLLPFIDDEDDFYRNVPRNSFSKVSKAQFSKCLTDYVPQGVPCVPVSKASHKD